MAPTGEFCVCGFLRSEHTAKKTCAWLKSQEDRLFPEPSCAECSKLVLEIARLNRELGKAQGELSGLRAGWSVSNHEAWEQGYEACKLDYEREAGLAPGVGPAENPFVKPEKKESPDANG